MFQVGALTPDIGILAYWTWPWENAPEHSPPAPQGGQPWVHKWRTVTCAGESSVSSARCHQSLPALLCKAWGSTSGWGSKPNLFVSLSSCSAKIFPSFFISLFWIKCHASALCCVCLHSSMVLLSSSFSFYYFTSFVFLLDILCNSPSCSIMFHPLSTL